MGQAGVSKDTGAGEVLFGTPAIPRKEFAKQALSIKKISRLEAEIKTLKSVVSELLEK
jgi:UDP-3-O-[3-hydroxymyristoyl] glucosamine N-acyltransferase